MKLISKGFLITRSHQLTVPEDYVELHLESDNSDIDVYDNDGRQGRQRGRVV